MNLLASLILAVRALLRIQDCARSSPTLGIIIGVGAVIVMLSIGDGAKASVREADRTPSAPTCS